MAHSSEKKSNTRLAIASSLFLASIFASFLISYLSNTGTQYWVMTQPLPNGVQISASDVYLSKADLGRGISGYLSSGQNPVGSITRRTLRAGEILNSNDLSINSEDLDSQNISISIRASDIPQSTSVGDIVSLYQVFDSRNGEEVSTPRRVISGLFIREVSRKSANFGSDLSITLNVHGDEVATVLEATSSGRLVVVAHGG